MLLAAACSTSDDGNTTDGAFSFSVQSGATLVEGDPAGVDLQITLQRQPDFNEPVNFSVAGGTTADLANLTTSLSAASLGAGEQTTTLNVRLSIDTLPILAQQRTLTVTASSENRGSVSRSTTLNVEPVDAPDVYLLIGQSNMVGFSGDGTKQAGPGEADEPNARILQLNVTKNSELEVFTDAASYTSRDSNVLEPALVTAEDPLHVPLDPFSRAKQENYIGLGLSFAKRALNDTSRDIVLVPAAWSGSAFCINSLPAGNWNPTQTDGGNLGNTLLYDRAITRTNIALQESGGILRGILWHQGESDAFPERPACAQLYQQNLQALVAALRSDIQADARGAAARGTDANIPFVAGTMSRGIDERGDFSAYATEKQLIDDVHRSVASIVSNAALSNHDDLTPANGFPCGNTSCIHFGAEAFREMGVRYYAALRQAATR